jgi:hypothetical protein
VSFVTPRIVILITSLAVSASPLPLHGQAAQPVGRHWRSFIAGMASSIALHEVGHIAASLSMGATPTFGFDAGRPTVYSGIDVKVEPHKQFIFSSAGLTVQSLIDEIVLDAPHSDPKAPASPFERGILAGGIGTTLFYLTIGRRGSVSDVEFMARTHALTTTQVTLIYGSIAALHALRISRGSRYEIFFLLPAADGRILIGIAAR